MIKTILVGFGFAAKVFHLPHLVHSDKYEVVGVVSRSGASKEYGDVSHVPVYRTLDEALSESDATLYIITTPSDMHYDMLKQCILTGKDVLVEKPAFLTVEEGNELIQLTQKSDSVVSVHQNRRWDGDFLTIQQMLQEETLGDWKVLESRFDRFRPVTRDRWREQPGIGSGILYDLGSHLIDQALVLFGEPDAIYAEVMTQRENGQTDDGFFVVLHYGEKRVYLRSGSFINSTYPRFEMHGVKGSFVKYGLDKQEPQLIDGTFYQGKEKEVGTIYIEETKEVMIESGGYDHFFSLLADGLAKREPVVSLEEALKVTRFIELARISSDKGRVMRKEEWMK
ncbi:Gfo/Idh/MocA family oxidoreductase [Cytobacillus sp. S13-E01]|uniref:Gfo/Idh/MocA family oxidoreductase n=1 Tax=Cytobacillus sp. S13-E01 TaxID=3031326 RepID=UPI0023D8395C|nr:Gfo/Idh/MocA family oxidoreductase [Cytobacillus sp. S13-E01]MDF0728242.1 Gfo/Idh/MocA family oxidoreductase [Cytobacillus sp. S13-E01]